MLKVYTEAATEELSIKKIELSEVRERNEMIETQRNKKKSEEAQEDEMLRRSKKIRKTMTCGSTLKKTTQKREDEARRTELKEMQRKGEN